MLEQQVRPSDVLDSRVLKALKDIARDQFVDEDLLGLAFADTELPIGYGQTMLSPVLQGRLLQAIDIQSDEEVLEIGTGNGYFTALLAQLAKHVTSVEIVSELSVLAQQNLTKVGIDNVMLSVGDASHAWELSDRIDVIIATAAFVAVPNAYLQSLAVGGRMLAVVGEGDVMAVQIIQRITEWEWQTEAVFETVIPAMINAEPKPEFEF
ncbi:MAG: protein-L-isoaspartate O-methyltransferase [Gammaproteobacteria bacterium]|nr:MAG: protein-L-isoaspartate O-methyltransferase [Gammaproteobacteria bacterium]RKZ96584.1 MAG: protein-L-isoaspartate O-methyltransferase [Gammaproteobacteria bacterium]RLA02172.1 MAG: protein-L-isoaspartate O-methyltransferase [Gammaproteobacteria bacterium]